MSKNDTGKRIVELDQDLIEFLIENCEMGMKVGLIGLQHCSRDVAERVVENIEKFKQLKAAAEKAK